MNNKQNSIPDSVACHVSLQSTTSQSPHFVSGVDSNMTVKDGLESHLVRVVTGRTATWIKIQILIWIAALSLFLIWWFQSNHFSGIVRFVINSLLLAWTFVVPAYFLFFVQRMKVISSNLHIPGDMRIAMVTTRAPSEPFEILKKTLLAMLAQQHPHDTWLADEDPTHEIIEWCQQHGVMISTRKGISEYHNAAWPRRTKCKEGNLAYFYDKYGYEKYDVVVQLDADHVPVEGYLEAMLRPFALPTVGYVTAPSICDSNAQHSWAARGRLYSEAIMHGPLQAGYNAGFAPLCIGSHYAVRTKALREIGGLGPELAEDHSTTLMFNAAGWRGIHALDAIAHGEGPPSFSDCITQEFQWSRSLMVLLLTLLPKCWKNLPWKLRIQFLFSELWYPLFSISMLIGISLPIIAVATGQPWVKVSYLEFLMHITPMIIILMSVQFTLLCARILRPASSPLICWEVALFQLVRWPWSLYGSMMGILSVARKSCMTFRVTPKGQSRSISLPWRVLFPYLAILVITFMTGIAFADAGDATGYHLFIIATQVCYSASLLGLVVVNYREAKRSNVS